MRRQYFEGEYVGQELYFHKECAERVLEKVEQEEVMMPRQREDLLRTRKIRIMRKGGASLREIGEAFDISGERVRQIWTRNEKRICINKRIESGVITREQAIGWYGESLNVGGV